MRRCWVFFVLYIFSSAFAFSLAQENDKQVFDLLCGTTYNKKDTLLLGNGYHISIKNYKTPFFHPSDSANLILDFAQKSLSYGYNKKEKAVWKVGDCDVLLFQEGQGEDSIPTFSEICYVLLQKKKTKVVVFSKVGSIDTLFINKLASEIVNNRIPASVFKTEKGSVYFLGEKISVKGYENRYLRQISTKRKLLDDVNFNLTWDVYTSSTEIDEKIERDVKNFKNRFYSGEVLKDTIDSLIFRGDVIPARRVSAQHKRYLGEPNRSNVYTNYFINTKVDSLNLFLNLELTSDTSMIKLPKFVEDNFFKFSSQPEELPLIYDTIPIADTIYIPKKNRMPIWTYYDKNTRINGLSLGFGEFAEARNVTTNGLRIDAIGSSIGIPFGLVYLLFSKPHYLFLPTDGFLGYNESDRDELKYKCEVLLHNRLNRTNGIKISVLGDVFETSTIVNGLSISGLANFNFKQNGLSIVGLYNYAYKTNGLQIGGLVAYSMRTNGIQIGMSNQSLLHNGMQLGAYNYAKEHLSGVQFGGFNRANHVNGIQIGVYNYAKFLKGIQIGLWNKNQSRSLPIFNWGK